ncbi:rod shape-determining protein MreC [Patescibacteria group bacterium]|nr:rod shape-determining protein MreC [Patescibacteria group bacterium]MBU2219960.1 rod shape-determining protein MreC [Patescibacteria group bacterium]MBU2264932.1 rod shape-determining protein MreC [Patescibacteria group bacterium]
MKNTNKSKLINFIIILAVILLLIFFNWWGWLTAPKSLVFWAARPVIGLFQAIDKRVSVPWDFFITLKDLSQENANLMSENKRLFGENSRFKETARENEILRQQLNLDQPAKQKLIMASVTGYSLTSGQYLLINKGRTDGVAVGLAVVAANNFLVGRVAEAADNFSKVLLVTDGNSSVNALTQDTRVNGAVKGNHGLGVTMEMIPIDAQININETVLSSGLNDGVPRGLVIGRVIGVDKKANEIWQSAVIAPAAEINNLEQVFILVNWKEF